MRGKAIINQDTTAGLLLVVVAVAGLLWSLRYGMGRPSLPGPGFAPFLIFLMLGALGLAIAARGRLATAQPLEKWHFRPLLLVLSGLVIFGLAVDRLGFLITGALLVALCGWAVPRREIAAYAFFGGLLLAGATAVFVLGLGVPMSLWPSISAK